MIYPVTKCCSIFGSSIRLRPARHFRRCLHHSTKRRLVFGIETSCDDTAMAVVDETGDILGEAHHSQLETHVRLGGIIPPLARHFHQQNIDRVHRDTLAAADVDPREIDAVAVTNMPGLSLSLEVGVGHAKKFCKENSLPLIPIHHMQAHALAVRCGRTVEFPYLVLLVSGGHCQVAVVRNATDFALLGTTTDDAPGEVLDKVARRLKLNNLREFRSLSGGAAVEILAKRGNPTRIEYKQPMTARRDCDFSFSGFKSKTQSNVRQFEQEFGIQGDAILPNAADICASVQYYMFQHIMKRTWRAMIYCRYKGIDFGNRLVISGGVARSTYLRMFMKQLCEYQKVELFVPPANLCSDNGAMIAWNGMERLLAGEQPIPTQEVDRVHFRPTAPLGEDLTKDIASAGIQIPRWKFDLGRLLKETGNEFADEVISAAEERRKKFSPDRSGHEESEALQEARSAKDAG